MAKKKPSPAQKPVKKRGSNVQIHTPSKKSAFLAAFAESGNMELAAISARCALKIAYVWLKADPKFAEAFKLAKERSIQKMEAEARRRAVEGMRRLKFTKSGEMICIPDPSGEMVEKTVRVMKNKKIVTETMMVPKMIPYVEHEYSDTLMIFLLKSLRPEIYRERYQIDIEGKTINANFHLPVVPSSQSQLPSREELIAEAEQLLASLKNERNPLTIEGEVLSTNGHVNGSQSNGSEGKED